MAKCFLIAAFLLLFCTQSFASSWTSCGSNDLPIKVKNVRVVPDPAVGGKDVEFQVDATTNDTISSGKLIVSVYYYGIYIHQETHNLCDKTSCPAGPGNFLLTSGQPLPSFTPTGPYKVKLEVVGPSKKLMACALVNFRISSGGSSI